WHVERKVTRREPARPRVLRRGENLSDRIERLEIRDGIRPRGAPDRLLIDKHRVTDELGAVNAEMFADAAIPVALRAFHGRVQHVVYERGLARSADARDAREETERDVDVDVLEVVLLGAQHLQMLNAGPAPRLRHGNREFVTKVFRRERSRLLQQALER